MEKGKGHRGVREWRREKSKKEERSKGGEEGKE